MCNNKFERVIKEARDARNNQSTYFKKQNHVYDTLALDKNLVIQRLTILLQEVPVSVISERLGISLDQFTLLMNRKVNFLKAFQKENLCDLLGNTIIVFDGVFNTQDHII